MLDSCVVLVAVVVLVAFSWPDEKLLAVSEQVHDEMLDECGSMQALVNDKADGETGLDEPVEWAVRDGGGEADSGGGSSRLGASTVWRRPAGS